MYNKNERVETGVYVYYNIVQVKSLYMKLIKVVIKT